MKKIQEIPLETQEGRLLLAAISIITTLPGYRNKTPDEALAKIVATADVMYRD